VTTILVTMIVITILLTVAFANTQPFPSALNKTEGNMATTTKENMIDDSDNSSGVNATERNESGKISGLNDWCPFSFC
jgi:hypothetical protein